MRSKVQVSRVTFPWAILSLLIAVPVGLWINHAVEAEWIAPVAMGVIMIGLIGIGRFPRRSRREGEG